MAKLFQRKDAKVEKLIKAFRDSFGSKIEVYDSAGNVVSEAITLGAAGLKESGAFECRSSLTVGSFIERMAERGLIVKVFTTDDVEVIPGVTLETSGKITGCTPEEMEKYNAYSRNKGAEPAAEQPAAQLEVAAQSTTEAQGPVNLPAQIGAEAFVFFYKYKVGGKDVQLRVDIVDDDLAVSNRGYEDESPVQITDESFFIPEENRPAVPFNNPAINDCVDYDDCGILLAKHFIKDNDGEVLMTIGFLDGLTLRETFSTEIKLTKDLNFALTDDTPCPETLYLNNFENGKVLEHEFFAVQKREDFDAIVHILNEDGDFDDLLDEDAEFEDYYEDEEKPERLRHFVWDKLDQFDARDFCYVYNEATFDFYLQDRDEKGTFNISSKNLFNYGPWPLIQDGNYPKALLVRTSEAVGDRSIFKVPEDFDIRNCHFADRSDFRAEVQHGLWPTGGLTTFGKFKYNGLMFYSENEFAKDMWEDEWSLVVFDDENKCYKYFTNFNLEQIDKLYGTVREPYDPSAPITKITKKTYPDRESLETVDIPNTVTEIGKEAFINCTKLKSVVIPDSVTKIGNGTFFGCESLESVVIPNSITQMGESAFSRCFSLKSVVIPNSITQMGESAFSNCSSLKSVVLVDGLIKIGERAFQFCRSLEAVAIPDSVTEIGKFAFGSCAALESVAIPNSVKIINDYAFNECTALKSVVIPDSVTEINRNAFSKCSALQSVTLPDSVTSIGRGIFKDCPELKEIIIPAGTKAKFVELGLDENLLVEK